MGGSRHYEMAAFATIALVIFLILSWNAWQRDAELTAQYVKLDELRQRIGVSERVSPRPHSLPPEKTEVIVNEPSDWDPRFFYDPSNGTYSGSGIQRTANGVLNASGQNEPYSGTFEYDPVNGTISGSMLYRTGTGPLSAPAPPKDSFYDPTEDTMSRSGGIVPSGRGLIGSFNAEARKKARHHHLQIPESEANMQRAGMIELNSATIDQLKELPGIGEVRAKDIIAERTRRGGFDAPSNLLEVAGIGEKTLNALEGKVFVSWADPSQPTATPAGYVPASALVSPDPAPTDAYVGNRLNLNRATREQLKMLPGIGPKRAEDIISYRHRRGGFRHIEELLEIKGIGMKTYRDIAPHVIVK